MQGTCIAILCLCRCYKKKIFLSNECRKVKKKKIFDVYGKLNKNNNSIGPGSSPTSRSLLGNRKIRPEKRERIRRGNANIFFLMRGRGGG